MLRGFTTITHFVDDVPTATAWYSNLLGIEPYFAKPDRDNPAYVEFRVGDYQHELGLINSQFRPSGLGSEKPAGAVTYWQVDDVRAALDRVVELGGTVVEDIVQRGEGFVTATAADPFGNLLGLMHSPHYLEVLGRTDEA